MYWVYTRTRNGAYNLEMPYMLPGQPFSLNLQSVKRSLYVWWQTSSKLSFEAICTLEVGLVGYPTEAYTLFVRLDTICSTVSTIWSSIDYQQLQGLGKNASKILAAIKSSHHTGERTEDRHCRTRCPANGLTVQQETIAKRRHRWSEGIEEKENNFLLKR